MGIVLKNVSYKYDNNSNNAINNISINISDNEIIGVLGKSGSGKSTLLKVMSGLLIPNGEVLTDKKVSYISNNSQSFYLENPLLRLIDIITCYDINKVYKSFQIVNISKECMYKTINELTHCEKLLISIALDLLNNSKIIIFDDLFADIDYKNKKNMLKLIRMLKIRYNKTIIISSNDVDLLYEICDNIIVLYNGFLILYGDPISVFKETQLIKKYNISIPKVVYFENFVKTNKNIKLLNSKTINDLIKEIYRNE